MTSRDFYAFEFRLKSLIEWSSVDQETKVLLLHLMAEVAEFSKKMQTSK